MKIAPGRVCQRIDLNGEWEYMRVPEVFAAGAERLPKEFACRKIADVPGYWEEPQCPRGCAAGGGTGFYRRKIGIGQFRRATLTIGPLLPGGAVFCNGKPAGTQYGGLTAAEFDLSGLLVPDAVNELVVAVRRSPPERENISAYGSRRGGIGGGAVLRLTGNARIRDWFVSFETEVPHWHFELADAAGCTLKWRFSVKGRPPVRGSRECGGDETDFFTEACECLRWSDRTPELCELAVELWEGSVLSDADDRVWGAVHVGTRDMAVIVNGQPVFLRGAMDSCGLTGTASFHFDRRRYAGHLRELKAAGFNFIRCRSRCPPEQFYAACDEVGMLVQTELPPVYSEAQAEAVIRMIRRHPCAVIFCEGNGKMLDDDALIRLRRMAEMLRRLAPGMLFLPQQCLRGVDSDLSPDRELRDKPVPHDPGRLRTLDEFSDLYAVEALGYCSRDRDLFPGTEDMRRLFTIYRHPCLLHEPGIMDGCLDLFRPSGEGDGENVLNMLRNDIVRHGIWNEIDRNFHINTLMVASMRKQLLEDIRSCGFLAGYGYHGGIDMLGRINGGDPGRRIGFCEEKYGESPESMLSYNGDTVMVCGAGKLRNRTAGQMFSEEIVLSHYGPRALTGAVLTWRVKCGGSAPAADRMKLPEISVGSVRTVARVEWQLPETEEAMKFTLETTLFHGRDVWKNAWDFWCFPEAEPVPPPTVRLRSFLTDDDVDFLTGGGAVLLTAGFPGTMDVEVYRPHLPGRSPGHAGTVIHPHPVWERFPHAEFAQWHFFPMMTGSLSLTFDADMPEYVPILELIPPLKLICRKALLCEFRVGGGRLMVCGLRLGIDDPGARWMKHLLLTYLAGGSWAPAPLWPPEHLRRRLAMTFPVPPVSTE
ncbi:MAG: hypothetical protein MR051_05345 [Lentisphaeria bacterium]|nr:hypothetical protein [Lentisphaeria bacterium]